MRLVGLWGLALILALASPAFAQKKKKGKDESELGDQKIRIIRMNPVAFTLDPNAQFYLQVRVEPEDANRHLVIILESGIERKVSSKSIDGAEERAMQIPYETFLTAGHYKVVIATCDGHPKGDDPADLGKVVHKIEKTFIVGGGGPTMDESETPAVSASASNNVQLPTRSNYSSGDPSAAESVRPDEIGNPCYLKE